MNSVLQYVQDLKLHVIDNLQYLFFATIKQNVPWWTSGEFLRLVMVGTAVIITNKMDVTRLEERMNGSKEIRAQEVSGIIRRLDQQEIILHKLEARIEGTISEVNKNQVQLGQILQKHVDEDATRIKR